MANAWWEPFEWEGEVVQKWDCRPLTVTFDPATMRKNKDMTVEDVLKAYELLVQAEKKSYVITEMI